jgi:hydrogenase maturation protein HypF
VLGLALDGVGLGSNGGIWGGELLQLDGARCRRLGGLRPLALAGGDRAAREPWRMAAAALHALGRSDEIPTRCGAHFSSPAAARAFMHMLDTGVHCPPTSSLGRLFDAAAGLLGLCAVMRFEAEAAIALEQAATAAIAAAGTPLPLQQGWHIEAGGDLDLRPLLAALADARAAGQGAALFHVTLGAALFDWLQRAAHQTGLDTVAVGGGCLFNRLLAADLNRRCTAAGLQLLSPQRLLPGDSAIALGQAWVAQRILMEQS